MNRNTSPSSRLSRRQSGNIRGHESQPRASRKKRESASRAAAKVRDTTQARLDTRTLSMPARIRRAFFTVVVADGIVFALIVAVALATVLLTASPAAWLPTIIATSWMVANGVAVEAGEITIAMVPLLPAAILFALVAKRINGAVKRNVSVKSLIILLACVLTIALAFDLIAWFMLWDAAKVYEVSPPSLGMSIAKTLILHIFAVAAGMPARLWRALANRYGVKLWIVDGSLCSARFLWMNFAVALLIVLLLFGAGWDKQHTLLAQYPSMPTVGLVSLILLSVTYVPNAVIGTVSVLMGSDFHIGQASISLFDIHLVPLPPLPIAAIIPASAPSWAPALMVIPLACAFALFWKKQPTILQALSTGVWAGVHVLVLVWFSSGVLGIYGSTGSTVWLTALLAAAWTAGCGLAFALAHMVAARSNPTKHGADADELAMPPSDNDEQADAPESTPESITPESIAEQETQILDAENPEAENPEAENPDAENVIAESSGADLDPDALLESDEVSDPATLEMDEVDLETQECALENEESADSSSGRDELSQESGEEAAGTSAVAEETLEIIDGEIVEDSNREEK